MLRTWGGGGMGSRGAVVENMSGGEGSSKFDGGA